VVIKKCSPLKSNFTAGFYTFAFMETEFILYVANQEASRAFYETVLDQRPSLHVQGMTEFTLGPGLKLGLMPEDGIAKILAGKTPHPNTANGVPRCELYLKYGKVNEFYARALQAGATLISAPAARDWGHQVAYVADPDGHILAFAGALEKTE